VGEHRRYSFGAVLVMTRRSTKFSNTQACSLTNLSLGVAFHLPVAFCRIHPFLRRMKSLIRSELVTPASIMESVSRFISPPPWGCPQT
jgi:hypothetical protein